MKNLRQVATAVGDGARAATKLEKYARIIQEKTGLHPQPPVTRVSPASGRKPGTAASSDSLLTEDMRTQLTGLFAKMEQPLQLMLSLDQRPISGELRNMMQELAALTGKLTVHIQPDRQGKPDTPCVQVCHADGTPTRLAFHGVPGGHEFNAFIIGLYNASGPGQTLDSTMLTAIRALDRPLQLKVLVSLSCTLCPDMVMAVQLIAAENKNISAEVYALNRFPALQEQYHVMSVPCRWQITGMSLLEKRIFSSSWSFLQIWNDARMHRCVMPSRCDS